MTTPNVRDLMVVPGKLSYGPSDLATAYPHGGTALGLTKGVIVSIGSHFTEEAAITAEEYGGEIVDAVQQRDFIVVTSVLHSWDKDALALVFPNTAEGGVSARRLVTGPGSVRAGSKLSARAQVLVFTPDDEDHMPMWTLHKAIPAIDEAVDLNAALDEELGVGIAFWGIRDNTKGMYSWGRRHDITV